MTERWFVRGVAALACVALATLFYPLFRGELFFWGAVSSVVYPAREFALEALANGQIPLWNPYNGAGVPLLAQYEGAFFYPFTWLAFILPLGLALSLSIMAHLFIAGAGMWVFMGRLHVPAFGQGVSAFAFGLSHYFLTRLGEYPLVTTAAWLPWVLWAVFTVLVTGQRRDMRWVALFVALMLLAGHAQMAVYSLLLSGLFALFWLVRQTRTGWQRRSWILAAGLCLGLLIATLQLLPVLELWVHSVQAEGLPFTTITQRSYRPEQALNLLSPNVPGGLTDGGTYHGGGDSTESALYIGLLPLVAAALAVIGWVRSGLRRVSNEPTYFKIIPFCIVVAAVAYVLALGDYTRAYAFLYEHWPTFNAFAVPARWHIWTVFALSVLAGIGTQIWQPGPRLFHLTRSVVMGAGGVVVVAGLTLLLLSGQSVDTGTTEAFLQAAVYTALVGMVTGGVALLQPVPMTGGRYQRWALVMIALVAADLSLAAWDLNPTVPMAFYDPVATPTETDSARRYWTPAAEAAFHPDDYQPLAAESPNLWEIRLANLNTLDRQALLNHKGALQIAEVADYLALLAGYPEHRPRLLQAAYTGLVYDESGEAVLLDIPLTRAWLVEFPCWHMDSQVLIQAMLNTQWDPMQQVHLLGTGDCAVPSEVDNATGQVLTIEAGMNSLNLQLSLTRDAFLVVADSHYPGWHVWIDGLEGEVLAANLAFRAVKVPAGAQTIQFNYVPAWLLPGAMCSIIGLLLLLLLFRLAPLSRPVKAESGQ